MNRSIEIGDVIKLPHMIPEGRRLRDAVSTAVRATWKAANEWTKAFNAGSAHLKRTSALLLSLTHGGERRGLPEEVHEECHGIDNSIQTMIKDVKSLKEQVINLENIISEQEIIMPGSSRLPVFSTIPLARFHEVVSQLSIAYERETQLKQMACLPLTRDPDEHLLNTAITLWTNNLHIPRPYLYHIKILLYEAKLL